MDNPDTSIAAKLLAEQMARYRDLFNSNLKILEAQMLHNQAMNSERHEILRSEIQNLSKSSADHETRIRALNDSAVTFRTWSSLFNGGAFVAAMTALIRSLFGG